jgi:carboxymethylenebutenolidase
MKDLPKDRRSGCCNRRELLKSLAGIFGSCSAAGLLDRSAFATIAQSGAQPSNVDVEMVEYPSGDTTIQAYVAAPKGGAKHPAVVVIHDPRGLNDYFRTIAQRFANEGVVALVPDLVSRSGGASRMKPAELSGAIGSLPLSQVIDDLKAGVTYLAGRSGANPQAISSVGFGWSGFRSFVLATAEPRLRRSVVFYGTSPETGYDKIQAAVLAHYAKWDNRLTGNALWTEEMMQKAGKKYRYYVYDADNDFFDDTNPRYNAQAATLAWKRTLDFIRT